MCLIAFAIEATPACPLLLASNRDEWWHRPTRPLAAWQTDGGVTVWAGQDAEAGGTWLGFSQHGRVAMLTNVRPSGPESAPRSRGELPLRWLAGPASVRGWRDLVAAHDPQAYNGFNLVLGDVTRGSWVWLTNRPPPDAVPAAWHDLPPGWAGRALPPGVYGLSNAHLDTPWPKIVALRDAVHAAVARSAPNADSPVDADGYEALLRPLMDRRPAHGAGQDAWAQGLSSAFVHLPTAAYGTRSSLIAHCRRTPEGLDLDLREWTHAVHPAAAPTPVATHWPTDASIQRCFSISRWGMPTSS